MEANRLSDEEALAWMARRSSGTMTQEDVRAFEAWRRKPENAAAFERLEGVDARLGAIEDMILAKSFEDELHERADNLEPASLPRRAIAAGIAVSLLAGAAIFAIPRGEDDPVRYATSRGELKAVALADGSKAELNTETRLSVSYSGKERAVALAGGEALFSVERNARRPFVVSTAHSRVVVTGTVFNVATDALKTEVSVVSGAVDVTVAGGAQVTVLAGKQLVIDAETMAGVVQLFDPNLSLAWRLGKARFDATPLGDVLADLNRYFKKPITLAEPELATLPVTGEFDLKDQQTAVNALVVAFGLEQTAQPARIVLARKN